MQFQYRLNQNALLQSFFLAFLPAGQRNSNLLVLFVDVSSFCCSCEDGTSLLVDDDDDGEEENKENIQLKMANIGAKIIIIKLNGLSEDKEEEDDDDFPYKNEKI